MQPMRNPPARRTSTPVGFIPSKRRSNVKAVEEMNTVSELREARKRVLQGLPTCDAAIRPKFELRLQQIDDRLAEISNVNAVTSDLGRIRLDNLPGPSFLTSASTSPSSPPLMVNGDGPLMDHQPYYPSSPTNGINGPPSPTIYYSPMSHTKTRILAKLENEASTPVSKHKPPRVQMMTAEDTVRMERQEHIKELDRQQRIQADRDAKEQLKAHAMAQGLTDDEKKRRIMAFMNYKCESDEDDDEDEEYEDMDEHGDFGASGYGYGPTTLTYSDNEETIDDDSMDVDQLSHIIKVDPKHAR